MQFTSRVFRFTLKYKFYFICAALFLLADTPLYAQNKKGKNDEKTYSINPKILVYNYSADSSTAYIKIYTSELLHKKDSDQFFSYVRIELFIYPSYGSKTMVDSTSLTFFQSKIDDDPSRYLMAQLNFRKPALQRYVMKFNVKDLNRMITSTSYLSCSSNNNQNQYSMLMMPVGSDFPYFTPVVTSRDSFYVFTGENQPQQIYVRYFENKASLAPPPHSNYNAELFSYIADSTFTSALNRNAVFNFTKSGLYHFQFDTLKKSGFTVFKFNEDFPKVAYAEDMVYPLRYLTTSKEFNDILNAESKGAAIEKFWVEKAGDKDKARKLISTFYNRMEFANISFTSYTEGWRTDRGMIYMILGKPVRIETSDKKEVWTYSNIEGVGSLNFEFQKMFNPFTENDYILIRSQLYELPWYSAVNTWRQGRVFGD